MLLGLALVCVTAEAQSDKADFLVNDDQAAAEHDHPRIAVSPNGSFVVVWVDRRSGSADIYLQRFGADWNPVGTNRRINDDTGTAYQSEAAIAAGFSGSYSVVWKDYRNGTYPFDPEIYLQRFDTSLAPIDTNRVLTVELPDSLKETPDIALSPWGGGVVVWADYRNRNWDIYGQLIDGSGTRVGGNFRVNDDQGTAQQHAPRVAVSSEGWFAVVWYDNRPGNDDIYVQRFDPQARALGANVRVNSDPGATRQAFPDVATDGAGHFTVVWVDWRNGIYPANPDVYTRKFDTTMTPLSGESIVNQDNTKRAQREPTIAADRRGNVAIIWSDSSGTVQSFDIMGQMVDVDGVIREVNFQANSESDSAQMQADVALDGRYRYVTWVDKRNGHYDIYASITRYNDPTLVPSPNALNFEMLAGGDLPATQQLRIDHYGYNPLNFRVLRSHNWFQVAPTTGVTPASVTVSIATDTLPYGTYLGALTLYDVSNDDSTVQVTVRLDVTAPILHVSEDTLSFRVFAGVNDSVSQTLSIANSGAGTLNWSVNESVDWLRVDLAVGVNDTAVELWVNGLTLTAGVIVDSIVINAAGAVNSPQTVWVRVEVVDSQPYLYLDPDSIYLAAENPVQATPVSRVLNAGTGNLNWTATAADTWLHVEPYNGMENDTVRFSIDTSGLAPGLHVSSVLFTDPAAFRPTVRMPFVLDYLLPANDTILVTDLDLTPLESDSLLIQMRLHDPLTAIQLPLKFDPNLVTIDSVHFSPLFVLDVPGGLAMDTVSGVVSLNATCLNPDSVAGLPTIDLVWVHLTARAATGFFEMGEPIESGLASVAVAPDNTRRHPIVLSGQIRIQQSTSVETDPSSDLPASFALEQNYPNPFNPATTISFQVPREAEVELEVFNIIGQRVLVLIKDILEAGSYKMQWDGKFESGRTAPTGIYFYRLRAPGISLVRKMVLIK